MWEWIVADLDKTNALLIKQIDLFRHERIYVVRRTSSHNAKQILKGNYKLLTREEKRTVSTLLSLGHGHVFSAWPPPGKLIPSLHSHLSRLYDL